MYQKETVDHNISHNNSFNTIRYVLFKEESGEMEKLFVSNVLSYKGDDEEEILCELFLRCFNDFGKKSDQTTSKEMVDSYDAWYRCGLRDGNK